MNSSQIKRGHPGSVLLVLLLIWIAFRGCMDARSFLIETSRSTWDYINLGLTAIILIGVTSLIVKLWAVRWEILTDGRDVSLRRNHNELFRGDVDDLKVLGYDFGMLRLETHKGTVFAFPAFGMMKRFIRTDGRR